MKIKNFNLSDLFEPVRGNSIYTKEYGNKHKGEFPVYSASTNYPLTFINHYDYNGEYLTWSTNGFGGFLWILKGKFAINGDRGMLLPKKKAIDIRYVQFVLQPILRGLAKGRRGNKNKNEFTKVPLSMIIEVEIPIPVKNNGVFDLEKQKEIAEKYIKIEQIKDKLRKDYEEIKNVKINIIGDYKVEKYPVTEFFNLFKGKAKYTKKYIHDHPGDYPVYSSQTSELGEIGRINTYDYDTKCFTWTTDGVKAGTVFYRDGKFSITTHCGILELKEQYRKVLSFEYLFFILNQTLPNFTLGEWANKRLGIERMGEAFIGIPVKNNGHFDLEKQKEIAEKYIKMEQIKTQLKEDCETIQSAKVEIIKA